MESSSVGPAQNQESDELLGDAADVRTVATWASETLVLSEPI